jgi:putative DNA primase/helicase
MMVTGKTFNEVAKKIDRFVGNIEQGKIMTTDYEKNAERLQQISAELLPVDDNVRTYLKGRGLPVCGGLRMHPGLPYYDDGKFLRTIPAMIARVSAPDGSLITYHATFLENGAKANVAQVKKFFPPAQPLSGGAVRLTKDYRHIGITEGVESALACMRRFELPVWAAGNTSQMKSFVPPAGIESVIVFADNDANYAGQVAAYTLANKLMIQHGLVADVVVPGRVGDFADEHNNGALLDNVVIVKREEAQS